jgi:hypothetical protein
MINHCEVFFLHHVEVECGSEVHEHESTTVIWNTRNTFNFHKLPTFKQNSLNIHVWCHEGKALLTCTQRHGFTSVSVSFVVENENHIACEQVHSLLNPCVPYVVSECIAMYFVHWEMLFEEHIWRFRTHVPLYCQDLLFRHKSTTNSLRNMNIIQHQG